MIKHAIKIGIFVGLAILAVGTVVMLLWNCLVPEIFGGVTISFGQALGILALSKILFGSWKCGWGCGCGGGRCSGNKHQYWKNKMEKRMANMTEDEKLKFKEKYANCGWTEEKN